MAAASVLAVCCVLSACGVTGTGNDAGARPISSPSVTPTPTPTQVGPSTNLTVLRGVNVYDLPWYADYAKTWDGEPQSSYDFLARHGLKLIRMPFPWPSLQPNLGGPFNQTFVDELTEQVQRAGNAGLSVVLDLHNDCQFPNIDLDHTDPDTLYCGTGITMQDFDNVWLGLSKLFDDNKAVIGYDIMNEPNGVSAATWNAYSQSVVTTLRDAGDDTLLWIEGPAFSQTSTWVTNESKPWIDDPADNFMYSAHQYFVPDPTYPQGYDFTAYSQFNQNTVSWLESFVDWLLQYGVRGSIGEVGWPSAKETPSTWQQWNALAEQWYEIADRAKLWVTYFSATSVYDEPEDAYDAPTNSDGCSTDPNADPACKPPGISVAESQSLVIEAHPSF